MFSLAYPIDDTFVVNGIEYELDLSFDNVLRLFDLLQDFTIADSTKVDISIEMLFGCKLEVSNEQLPNIFNEVLMERIVKDKPSITSQLQAEKDKKANYSLTEDADYIFSSFIKDYGMNLIESQGQLHWTEFRALLRDLSDETKFKKVIEIRNWAPTEHTNSKTKSDMRKLQEAYALGISQEDIEEIAYFNSLSDEEKDRYARMKLEEKGGE